MAHIRILEHIALRCPINKDNFFEWFSEMWTQLNLNNIIHHVICFMHDAWEHPILETLEHLIAGGAKKLNGKVHLFPWTFNYWCSPIIVCASEFQWWLYRMDFCVFLNKIIKDKQWQASDWRMLSPTNRTVVTYCINCYHNNANNQYYAFYFISINLFM
jgi:hypothetical protein